MSKLKIKQLIQKGYVLAGILAILFASIGSSQALVNYDLSLPPSITNPSITNSSLINESYQSNSSGAALSAIVNLSTIPVNITASGIINSTNDTNAIFASVLSNSSTLTTDIALVSGSAPGSSLTSFNAQQNSTITAFSQVSNSSVTTNITNPFGGSSVSVSGNSISAETSLNKTSQTAQGKLNTSFDSSHAGTAPLSGTTGLTAGDAGLFVGSVQYNNTVSSGASTAGFADITGTNSIAMTATGTLGSSLNLNTDKNSISAAFTGNNAENLLSVKTGGATALTSTAGIANLQVNEAVNGLSNSAVIEAGSSISTSIQTNPLTSSSLSFDGNQLKASATGSVSKNELQIAAGLNVAADGAQTNSLNFTAGSETAITSGGLFLNNMQMAMDSAISATVNDPVNSAALSVDSRGLINSALTADRNSFEAIALGNDAYGSISVGGATSFNSAVAASNLQSVNNSPVSATANGGTLAVNLGGSAVGGGTTAIDNITGSTISVDKNTISALAVANRDPLLVNITGTTVTDGLTQTAGVLVNNATSALVSTSGLSAISSQSAATSSVNASNTGAGINLLTTNYPVPGATGSHVSDSTFTQSGNGISSLANINEGLVAVGIDANDLDASSAVASVQNASTSSATATTSGTIITGINTRLLGVGDTFANKNLSILVGDGNLSDKINDGNSISSTAGGNLNATALEANAATTMKATNIIDRGGASSNVLALSTSATGTNQTLAEMSVLTDQRLATSAIAATTDVSQIAGVIRAARYPLSDSTLNVDGNQVTATARGNLTTNTLDFSALSVDMTGAEVAGPPSTAAGSNLASMGTVQDIGANSSVTAQIIAAPNTNAEILGKIAGRGDRTNIALSVDNNSVVAAATGSTAISNLNGSGGSLAQDAPGTLSGSLSIAALPTTALSISNTALANAVVQSNAGSVSASLATTQVYDIDADIEADDDGPGYRITSSVITADNNRAVALATGLSADAGTALAFNTLESSAATAVQQAQSGNTTATVGGNGGGVNILASTQQIDPLAIARLINTSLSASENVAGAQATGATATSSLAAGGANTVTLASGYGDTTADGASGSITNAGVTTASADYMLGIRQNVSGPTTADAYNLSVLASGGRFAGGSVKADSNFLTAQATGGTSTAGLSLKANDMTASGNTENTVDAVLSSDQRLSGAGAVSATLTASDITASAINLTTAANGTNSSEAISASNNNLLAAGSGLISANALTTDAATSVAGDNSGVRMATIAGNGNVTATGWDRLIVSNQNISAAGTVSVTSTGSSVSAAVTGSPSPAVAGDVNVDTLKVENNSLIAQGTGGSSSNTLTTTAGAAITSLSQAIVARQITAAPVTVQNTASQVTLDIAGDGSISSLSTSGNQLAATATGLNGTNTLTMSSDASITDAGSLPVTNRILSQQTLAATALVTAGLSRPIANLGVRGAVNGSSLKVSDNIQEANAKGAVSSNTMSADSGSLGASGTEGVGFAIVAGQTSSAPISGDNDGGIVSLSISGAVRGSSLTVNGNSEIANASNLTGANTLTVNALTSNIGDASTLSYSNNPLSVTASADRSILSTQTVNGTGDVNAHVSSAMTLSVGGGLSGNGTAYMEDNSIGSSATVAGNSNTLTNSANTLLTSSALIVGVQSSSADATALTEGSYLQTNIETSTADSSVAMTGNEISAAANGLTADNTLDVTAGSIQGSAATGTIITFNILGFQIQTLSGLSAIRSAQTTSGAISATVDTPYLGIDLAGGVDRSAVDQDKNLIQASSTAASATNTLTEKAETSIVDAAAMLAATQTISGSSTAAVTDLSPSNDGGWIYLITPGNVSASNMSADSNTIQAIAVGGSLTNSLATTTGTTNSTTTLGGTADTAFDIAGLFGVGTFTGSYGLDSRQISSAAVTATIDQEPWVELTVGGNITGNSAVSASSNVLRAQATNLTATNSVETTTGTALNYASSGLMNNQRVTGATSATTSGAGVSLSGLDLIGAANADSNWLVAIATGGNATNDLDVSATSVNGGTIGGGSSLTTFAVTSIANVNSVGSTSLAGLLNTQTRTAAVTATMADQNTSNLDNLEISASLGAVTGSVSVSNNLMAAEARGLVADNSVNLTSKTLIDGGGAALGSTQSSTAATTSSINSNSVTPVTDDARIFLTATGATVGTAALNGNTALSDATSNLAINSLTAKAGTDMLNLGTSTTTTITMPVLSATAGTVGFALQNLQSGTAPVNSSITNFDIQGTLTSLNGTATVDNNTVLSQSQGQASQNSMVLDAGTALNTSASLANGQMNSGAINSTITNGNIGLGATAVIGTTSVSDNKVQASGTANLALNSMDIAGTLAVSTGGSTGSLTATADYAALNAQSNTAGVSSSLNNYSIRLADSSSTNGTASVLNNAILADATGNSSTNTFTISPKASSNTADFAFTGYQSNTGAITGNIGNISGATIGLTSAGGTGTFSLTGNRIGATTVGNSSISSIKSGK